MDRDSDMKPDDDYHLQDGDDFVLKSSDRAVLDEPVLFCYFAKNIWKMFVY